MPLCLGMDGDNVVKYIVNHLYSVCLKVTVLTGKCKMKEAIFELTLHKRLPWDTSSVKLETQREIFCTKHSIGHLYQMVRIRKKAAGFSTEK